MKHRFQPTRYHHTLGPHEPVLRVADGDTVATTTVDARGFDATGNPVVPPPNPQTGPFFIEGAAPGDTLEVRLDRIWPNRSRGWTRTVIAPNVIDPEYVRDIPAEAAIVQWQLDLEKGTATLDMPGAKLQGFTLPLSPMLGCFGVAPMGGQAISTATSGEHGGNMDYQGFVAGVRVYFPVFVEGALFHLGDGHAVQGDGEVIGTGIEVSMDVEMTFRVLKGRKINWPRAETEDAILAVGNARPLDQAVQIATTEMLRWLREDYEMNGYGASILLGQCARYELANMFDPAYTMVCKVPKSVLPPRTR
jgi:acetamidase/formamidase